MNLNLDGLWIEKYRPRTLDDLCLDEHTKQLITNYTNKQEIPNLLLVGKPGIGKTSLARIIIQDLLKSQFLYINASDENGIDTVRGRIMNFARTKSIDGNIKVILLDEVDGFTEQGQRALRNTMEEYAKFTRFILTANYAHKITPALKSRCQSIAVESTPGQVFQRCRAILAKEHIMLNNAENVRACIQMVKESFPDIRKCINNLQRCCASGSFVPQRTDTDNVFASNILKMVLDKKSVVEIRQSIIDNEDRFSNDYHGLLKSLLNCIYEQVDDDNKKQLLICVAAEHMYRSAFVMDQEINAFHCIINMINIT